MASCPLPLRVVRVYPLSVGRAASPSLHRDAICDRARVSEIQAEGFAHAEQRVPSGYVCLSQYQEVRVSVRPDRDEEED